MNTHRTFLASKVRQSDLKLPVVPEVYTQTETGWEMCVPPPARGCQTARGLTQGFPAHRRGH
jgi:hypothetical protein